MKFWRLVSILLVLAMLPLFPGGSVHAAAVGTAFTYQGRLTTSGSAVDQTCGFQFSLFDALTSGSQQGSTLTKSSVSVSDGLFNVGLDFGSSIYTGNAVFLNITVRCPDSGSYTSLSPRQELTPTPYSVFATTAGGVQDNDNDTKIQAEETTDEDKIRFDTAGSERMIIDGAGLVGIGTTSPTSALTITSPVSGALQFDPFGTSAGNTGEERFLELAANGSNYVGWKAPDSIATPEIWTLPNADGSSGQVLRTDGSNVLTWVTPGGFAPADLNTATDPLTVTTEYHTDTSGGAFTATLPSAPADGAAIRIIDVKGDFDTNNLTVARGGSDTIEGGTSVTLSTENGIFDFHYDADTSRWSVAEHDAPAPITLHRARLERAAAQSIGASNTKVNLDTETYDVGGIGDPTTNNRIDIAQAGVYLINGGVCLGSTFNVQVQLAVNGTIVQRQILAENGNATGVSWCANASTVRNLAVSDAVTLQAFNGGTVNTATAAGDRPFLEVIQLATSAVAGVAISSIQDDDNDTKIQAEETADEDKIRFDTAGSERMIIDANGQVGIGTSSPVSPLDVSGVTHLVTLGVSGNATFANTILLANTETSYSQSAFTVTTSVTSAGNTVFDLDAGGNLTLDGQITLGSPITGNSSYMSAERASTNQSDIGATSDIIFNTVRASSGITLDTSTGVFTLEANKTYWLSASVAFANFSNANGGIAYEWVDSSNSSLNGSDGVGFRIDAAANQAQQPLATAIVTTSSSTGVKLRTNAATGTADVVVGRTSVSIIQIGTTDASLSSDRRLKKDISPLSGVSDDLARIQPVLFNWRSEEFPHRNLGTGTQLGLIAQDVEQVFPALVTEGDDGFKRVNYEHIPMLLLQGMKEQQVRIEQLESQSEALARLVCADHPETELCPGASSFSGLQVSPEGNQPSGPALWLFGSIGAVLAALGAVLFCTSRRRSGTAA